MEILDEVKQDTNFNPLKYVVDDEGKTRVESDPLKPFAILESLSVEEIVELIKPEMFQIQALIICHFEPEKAKQVMQHLNRTELLRLIANMRPVSLDIIREVERVIERKIVSGDTIPGDMYEGPRAILGGKKFLSKIDSSVNLFGIHDLQSPKVREEESDMSLTEEDIAYLLGMEIKDV